MKVGVVGLGLIGGSMAKAIKRYTKHEVIGWDTSEVVRANAKLLEVVDRLMIGGNPGECDIVFIAVYPKMTIQYVKEHASEFKRNALVVDCAGIKREICQAVRPIAEESQFIFCGGHPMAGIERSGFVYSKQDLFQGASMILTPYANMDTSKIDELSVFLKEIGFRRIQVSTPEEHDEMIAYTSQLAHVVSSAYVRSPLSYKFLGFSAGSFKDMTRVAKLNEVMWTELFLENGEYLANEIEELAERLLEYSKAIREDDRETLMTILKEGKDIRLTIDESREFD